MDSVLSDRDGNLYHDLWGQDYEFHPVSPTEFFTSPEYMGGVLEDRLWPSWIPDLEAVLKPGSGVTEFILTGASGIGKCVREDTLINTSDGFLEIRDLLGSSKLQVDSESGPHPVNVVHDEGVVETRRVVTNHGHELEGRPNHRVRVLSGLRAVWKRLDELKVGDVLLERPALIFGCGDLPDALAELVGWYVAEGCPVGRPSRRFSLSRSEVSYVYKLALRAGMCATKSYRGKWVNISGVFSDDLFAHQNSHTKDVPKPILRGSRRVICRFLRGLFSGDGSVCGGHVELTTVSYRLARQVRVLLTSMGYACSLHSGTSQYRKMGARHVCGKKYSVALLGYESISRFSEEIGFAHPGKSKRLSQFLKRSSTDSCGGRVFSIHFTKEDVLLLRALQPDFFSTSDARRDFMSKIMREQRSTPGACPGFRSDIRTEAIVHMHDVDGTTFREISKKLGVSYPCVCKRYHEKNRFLASDGVVTQHLGRRKSTSLCRMLGPMFRGSGCTPRYLRRFISAGGKLPEVLHEIAFGRVLFDVVRQVHVSRSHCFDLTVAGDPSYISDGFISHNTYVGTLAQFFKVYVLCCMKDPIAFYRLGVGSVIDFPFFCVTLDKADIGYEYMKVWMDRSPWFKKYAPRLTKPTNPIMIPSKRIRVTIGSQFHHALGDHVFGFILDEANFFKKAPGKVIQASDQTRAHQIYKAAKRRQENRFMTFGSVPGLIVLQGSETLETSFLEERQSAAETDPSIYVSRKSLWEAKPADLTNYCGKKFRVMVGDGVHESRVLDDDEIPPVSAEVIDVPVEHRKTFDEDTDDAIRDFAGRATAGTNKFFQRPEILLSCIDHERVHPFTRAEISISHKDPSASIIPFVREDLLFRVSRGRHIPICDPGRSRVLHCDIGLTGTPAAIGMAHLTDQGCLYYDFILRIIPPMDGEVDLDAILTFIKYLRSHGFRFASVTYDQYQSRHSIQSLEKAGFTGGTFSVGLDAYKELRRRVVLGPAGCSWYDYPVLIHELRMLQRPAKPDAPPDHPVGGTNDTAEVAAGCAGKAAALLVGKAVRRSVRGSTWTPWMG